MAYGKIDESNVVPLILAPVAAAAELQVFEFGNGVNSLFDFSMSDTLFSLGSFTDVTISMVLFLGAIGALVVQGQLDRQGFEREEWYVIVGSLATIPLYQLFPAFGNFVDGTPIIAFALWALISGAAVYISYKG